MAQSSRELVDDFFKGKSILRLPFLPWVCSFAAKLEQVPVRTMLSDPGVLSRSLSNAHKLFGYDVILNHFDLSLEAEAIGCKIEWQDDDSPPVVTGHPLEDGADFYDLDIESIEKKGRIPVILEATKRLILTKGKEVQIAAMITGPLTLARHLKGPEFTRQLELEKGDALDLVEDAGSICLKLCKTYCELGADIIVIAEDMREMVIHDIASVLASPLKSIFNVVRFYERKSILVARVRDDEQVISLCNLGADAVSVSGDIGIEEISKKAHERNCRFSVTLPDVVFKENSPEGSELIERAVKSGQPGLFLSSEWEVPRDTDVNTMHAIMKIIRGIE